MKGRKQTDLTKVFGRSTRERQIERARERETAREKEREREEEKSIFDALIGLDIDGYFADDKMHFFTLTTFFFRFSSNDVSYFYLFTLFYFWEKYVAK